MDPVERAVAEACRALGLADRRVLVAVSGGVDSTVLLHALARVRRGGPKALVVGHVNHGLRGAGSDGDEAHVRGLADALGLRCLTRTVAPHALREDTSSRERPTLQEAARRVRYDALEAMAAEAGCDAIATAHTLDDQAETVVLRLLRGAGPASLGGIPEASPDGRVVRPLLGVSRAEIERFARERGLSWREDPSNRDPQYARGRLREAGWDRIAADLNPNWLRAVGDLAEGLRRDHAWIESVVDAEAAKRSSREEGEGEPLHLRADGWTAMPEGLARRLARRALQEVGLGREVSRSHVLRFVDALRSLPPGRSIELPSGWRLRRTADGFRLERAP